MKVPSVLAVPALLGLAEATGSTSQSTGIQREDAGSTAWNQAMSQAQKLVDQMSLQELNNLTIGILNTGNGCSGNSGSIARLDYPGMCLQDGPAGSHGYLVTAFASGVSVAASFNRDLAYQRGFFMGAEFKRKGVQAANGPVLGPLGRIATDGRAWEGFGADPYLTGKLGASTVEAMQRSVIAVIKHYVANEQETQRYSISAPSVSSDVDDATLHELYVAPFQDAIYAGAASVMCSYNRINSTYACENDRTLNQILKSELNFPGFVVSDWVFGQRSGVKSAKNGLDMAMPNSEAYWANDQLANNVTSNSLAKERLQDMARRILSSWYLITGPGTGSENPGHGLPASVVLSKDLTDARDPASKPSTKQSAVEGHVLVKNVNNTLPLKNPLKVMSLFGWDGVIPLVNNPGTGAVTPLGFGYQSLNISDASVASVAIGMTPSQPPDIGDQGTILNAGGSGANAPGYMSDPYSAILHKAAEDDTYLFWDFRSVEPVVAQSSQACLVFVNQWSSEALDRNRLADATSNNLVKSVASQCRNTIVVIHNAWIRLVDDFVDHPNVTAIMYAHLPGQDSGRALVDLLYGKVSPSGRLPYTVAKQESDYGSLLLPATKLAADKAPHANFSEGVDIDYRHFLKEGIEPRFAFGYGLTYSSFSYTGLKGAWLRTADLSTSAPEPEKMVPGGIRSLFDQIAAVSVTVTNTGAVEAAEVAQLYVKFPNEDKVRVLKGFWKERIAPGSAKTAGFPLTRRDLSRWDVVSQSWQLLRGEYQIFVGKDVVDAEKQSITLTL